MLSQQITKLVQNLEKKKFRDKYNLFKVEGGKLVSELLASDIKIHHLYAYPEWIDAHKSHIRNNRCVEINEKEMKTISNFNSLPEVIALAEIPAYEEVNSEEVGNSLSLVLNGIQDPGNLGTILRLADWFGVKHLFCDDDCASFHNPKCVQASMGAVFRTKVIYTNLPELINRYRSPEFPTYGTFLEGENIYRLSPGKKGFIIMGNEGKGISREIERIVDKKITIPSFAGSKLSTESLNVGVAAGIILSEFKRCI